MIELTGIIIDSKSGVTGAGRGLSQGTHYPDLNEGLHAYKVASHRHTPEIEQTLSRLSGQKVHVTFVPHLLPVNRGILSTCYGRLKPDVTKAQVREIAEIKMEDLSARDIEAGMKIIEGTARSMGITVTD